MSNKKFSEFTLQTDSSNVAFVVGFNGSDNVRISPSNLIGSGFLPVSGGTMTGNLLLQDNIQVQIGTGADLKVYHNGTDSFIENQTGILKIQSSVVDGDISFLADNGSGTATEYFRLDGTSSRVQFSKNQWLTDNVKILLGNNDDLQIYHDSNDSRIENSTGDIVIQQEADDRDIKFRCDDGSGGTTEYFKLEGANTRLTFSKNASFSDNVKVQLGSSVDYEMYHDGTDTQHRNFVGDLIIKQEADDKDIIFQSDDGSGGLATYFYLDGSLTTVTPRTVFPDNSVLSFGTGADLQIYHSGTDSVIDNLTGDLYISNKADDKDIIFRSDDGSGGFAEYFKLDGSAVFTRFSKDARFSDNVKAEFGDSGDFDIYHDGTDSVIQNNTGDLELQNRQDDGNIVFKSDDGSGGVAEYFRLDGGLTKTIVSKEFNFTDNIPLKFGSAPDFQMLHSGSSMSFENSTGNLLITNFSDDSDIIFKSDDGSGGVTPYLTLDGNNVLNKFHQNLYLLDNVGLKIGNSFDLGIKHDGSDSYIDNLTGHLIIQNQSANKDIIFKSDDGSGGLITYFQVDGSSEQVVFTKSLASIDNAISSFGNDADLKIYHDSSNSYIQAEGTGDLVIEQKTDDKDILFKSDDGSGGVTTYFSLDGSIVRNKFSKNLHIPDNVKSEFGSNNDLQIYHTGSASIIDNITGTLFIRQFADDEDIRFLCDDGSGGTAEYFRLDGGTVTNIFSQHTNFIDSKKALFGTGSDLEIYHNGTDSKIENTNGDLQISNFADDKDIIFKSDDGSGGVAEYFRLDGSSEITIASKPFRFIDSIAAQFGTSLDMQIYHSGGEGTIQNLVGDLRIIQGQDDGDIEFYSDDGSGGTTEYFRVDGGNEHLVYSKPTIFSDNVALKFGDGIDLQIQSDGSSGKITNNVGDLEITQGANDSDIKFLCDNGSGGVTEYLTLDGSATNMTAHKTMTWIDSAKAQFGNSADLQIYHDGTNSYINNFVGELNIWQNADNKDIVFASDNGSGGVIEYLRLDGSDERLTVNAPNGMLFFDNIKAKFGTSGDLEIYHNSTTNANEIASTNSRQLQLKQDNLFIGNQAGTETIISAVADGAVELYHDNTKKFETASGGVNVNSGNLLFDLGYGVRFSDANTRIYTNSETPEDLIIEADQDLLLTPDGSVELYENSVKKFETTSSGVDVTGRMAIDDGNNNVSIGDNAGDALTTGTRNVAVGYNALSNEDTTGYNVAVGYNALATQNADSNAFNVAVGYAAGIAITTGIYNVLLGGNAGSSLNTGNDNVLIGLNSGDSLTSGSANIAIGQSALSSEDANGRNIAIGHATLQNQNAGADAYNVAIGYNAGNDITTGVRNTLIGGFAGDSLTTGQRNVALGYGALSAEDGHGFNTAIGHNALTVLNAGAEGYNTAVGYDTGQAMTTGIQNTLIGGLAGDALTTGTNNVAVGFEALSSEDAHSFNVAVGHRALKNQNAGASAYNTALGYNSGLSITTGIYNTLLGGLAGDALTTGGSNVAIGFNALGAEDTGSDSIAIGRSALLNQNYDGSAYNIAIGRDAGKEITTGIQNTLIGGFSGDALTTGGNNVALGYASLSATTIGTDNIAIGKDALQINVNGSASVAIGSLALEDQAPTGTGNMYNIAIGHHAGRDISTGTNNTLIGGLSGDALNTGDNNVVLGYASLSAETKGDRSIAIGNFALQVQNNTTNADVYNTAVGYSAGSAITTGDENTIIGGLAGDSLTTGTNNVIIGYNAEASTTGAADEITLGNANNDTIRAAVQTISSLSDERDKTNIQESTYGLDFINKLNPVTFDWDTRDGSRKGKKDLGFIAQELDAVDDEYTQLVYKSNPDKLEASYGRLVPVLVKAIQELKQEIEQLKNK